MIKSTLILFLSFWMFASEAGSEEPENRPPEVVLSPNQCEFVSPTIHRNTWHEFLFPKYLEGESCADAQKEAFTDWINDRSPSEIRDLLKLFKYNRFCPKRNYPKATISLPSRPKRSYRAKTSYMSRTSASVQEDKQRLYQEDKHRIYCQLTAQNQRVVLSKGLPVYGGTFTGAYSKKCGKCVRKCLGSRTYWSESNCKCITRPLRGREADIGGFSGATQ